MTKLLIKRDVEKAELIKLLKGDIEESFQNGDTDSDASWSSQRGILLSRKSAIKIVELLELPLSELIEEMMPTKERKVELIKELNYVSYAYGALDFRSALAGFKAKELNVKEIEDIIFSSLDEYLKSKRALALCGGR